MRRRVAAAAALAVLAAGCSASSTPHAGSTPTSKGSSTTSSYGGTIALSVAIPRIEAFVESERGLKFKHKVKVTLLSSAKFVAKLKSQEGKNDAKDAERLRATFSALGLIPASTDLLKAFRSAYDQGTIGFYDFKSKQLFVRGTKATPGVQAVLSHELTHALDDQWFGLNRPGLDKSNQELGLAFTALSEGDAERTRMDFEAKLSAADKAAATKEENSGGTPKVPNIVLQIIGFPYAAGPDFIKAVIAHGGMAALNAAYRKPPVSSEQILIPDRYFAHDVPKHVAYPHADGTVIDKGDLGLIGLFLTLSQQVGQSDAATGVRGWGGDEYVAWKASAGRYCLRDSIVMDDADSTAALHTALAQWANKSNGKMRLEQRGTTTTFISCSS
jgi:hypothetical protein